MSKTTFDDLVDEALENAKKDRKDANAAYQKMKAVFDNFDIEQEESMHGAMLLGQNAVKLLEQSSRANEQIIKLAQLKEKESRAQKDDSEPFNMEEIMKEFKKTAQSG